MLALSHSLGAPTLRSGPIDAAIFGLYDSSKVNKMPHVHEGILDIDLDDKIVSLLEIIESYGLQEQLSVWRIHRHFDIHRCEQIVTTLDHEDKSMVTHVVDQGVCKTIPVIWALGQDGAWCPMQFWSGTKSDLMEARLKIAQEKPEFWNAYKKALKEMKAESLIGLSIRIDDLIETPEGYTLVEGTRDLERYQAIKHVANSDVDAHFKSCIQRGVRGDLRMTHWSHSLSGPHQVGCKSIKCVTCGMYGSCYNHWPTKSLPERSQFIDTLIPRFRELVQQA